MKNNSTIFSGGLLMLLATVAHAQASHCYSIKNQNRKNYCLAQVKEERSYCYSIKEQDLKNFCLAEVSGQRSYCYSIRSLDNRSQCLAKTK
jgi:hypothetical protein